METLARLVRTASQAFDVAPARESLETTLKSPDAERRARFLCEGLARLAALAALAEANSLLPRSMATRGSAALISRSSERPTRRPETALMDRALAS